MITPYEEVRDFPWPIGKIVAKVTLHEASEPDRCTNSIVVLFTDGSQLEIVERGYVGEMELKCLPKEVTDNDNAK